MIVWDAVETRRYVWDGYNIAAEIVIDEVTPSTNVTYYTWGLDLSGTLQGAGGVGGLLAVVRNGTPYFPCYDANGNVTDYVDAYGNIRAHYEYSPFGEITAQSGDLADTFKFRFSTKYWDEETRSYYYGYRHYAPKLGCWLNRDPIEEKGGLNLYGFSRNAPIDKVDLLGAVVIDKIKVVGGLPWAEYQRYAIKYEEDPSKTLGLNYSSLDAAWECRECKGSSECKALHISKDTTLEGVVFWLNIKRKTRSGRTIGEHELIHLANIRDGAKDFDRILHHTADGTCVRRKCCFAKQRYLYKALSCFRAHIGYNDAFLDVEDYWGTDMVDAMVVFDQKRVKLENALMAMSEAETEMRRQCN